MQASQLLPTPHWQALDALAKTYVDSQCPANTRRAYAGDWRVWEDYTAEVGIPLYAATTEALVGFVRWLETVKQAAPATINRRLTGALAGLRDHHVTVDRAADTAACPESRAGTRDRALPAMC